MQFQDWGIKFLTDGAKKKSYFTTKFQKERHFQQIFDSKMCTENFKIR